MTTTSVDGLNGLLILELEMLLAVESRLAVLLPRLATDATDAQLRTGIERHAAETDEHAQNLETALRTMGLESAGRQSTALDGLEVRYREELAALPAAPAQVRDLAVAGHGAVLEHLEIAGYEAALQKADLLALDTMVELLEANLDDERRMLDEGESVSHRLASGLARARLQA